MIWGAKMLLKICEKINEFLDVLSMGFGAEMAKTTLGNSVPGGMRWVPGF